MLRLLIILLLISSLALGGCRSAARVEPKASSPYAGYELSFSNSQYGGSENVRGTLHAAPRAAGAGLLWCTTKVLDAWAKDDPGAEFDTSFQP